MSSKQSSVSGFINSFLNQILESRLTPIHRFKNVRINGQDVPLLLASEYLGVCAFFFIDLNHFKVRKANIKGICLELRERWQDPPKTFINPLFEAEIFKESLHVPSFQYSALFSSLQDVSKHYGLHCFVVCLNADESSVKEINNKKNDDSKIEVIGEDSVFKRFKEHWLFSTGREKPFLQSIYAYNRIQTWLSESESDKFFENFSLTNQQKELAQSNTVGGYRRINGAAGSGKSLVLAFRVAYLLSQGSSVLVLCFNITTTRYLEYLIRGALTNLNHSTTLGKFSLEVLHFHGLLGRIVPFRREHFGDQEYLDNGWAEEVLQSPILKSKVYDAVLIDEAQDWPEIWLKVALECVKKEANPQEEITTERHSSADSGIFDNFFSLEIEPRKKRIKRGNHKGGEIYLFSDGTQNIYSRPLITESEFYHLGFKGQWSSLDGCFRLPTKYLETINRFIGCFLPKDSNKPDLPKEKKFFDDPLYIRWIQIDPRMLLQDISELATQEICDIVSLKHLPPSLKEKFSPMKLGDVVFMTETRETGKYISKMLGQIFPYVHTTFEKKEDKEQFDNTVDLIKGSTIKSFKGMENRGIVLVIEKEDPRNSQGDIEDPILRRDREIYVALGRLKATDKGSCITVICQDPRYAEYGSTWSKEGDFLDYRKNLTYSQLRDESLFKMLKASSKVQADFDLPDWLPFLISQMKKAGMRDVSPSSGGEDFLNVYENVCNTSIQNEQYLDRYFPRSVCESYLVFSELFSNSEIRDRFTSMTPIRILSYGTGTGGDLLGTLMAMKEAGLIKKEILILAIEGNEDAREKLQCLIKFFQKKFSSSVKYRIEPYHVEVIKKNSNMEAQFNSPLLSKSTMEFDIIETSKMLNEIVRAGAIRAYANFEYQVVEKKLSENGLAVLLDVPILVEPKNETEPRWTPMLLGNQTKEFIKYRKDFKIVFPVPCQNCQGNGECYSAKIYSYKKPDEPDEIFQTAVTMRVLAREQLLKKIKPLSYEKECYVTTYRLREGGTKVCPSGLKGSQSFDAYTLRKVLVKR